MKVDARGRAFLTKEEGEELHQYFDAGGRPTIGVGHLLAKSRPGYFITKEESQRLLAADLARFEAAVAKLVKVPLTQNQFNALVSFAFNLGEGNLAKSGLLKLINAGRKGSAAITAAFALYRNVNGHPNAAIEARRRREAALFFTP
jgi:lysozyme